MEKPWPGWPQCANNERFGSMGSYVTRRFFSTAVFEDEVLLVYHTFEDDLKNVEIEIPEGFKAKAEFHAENIKVSDGKIVIKDTRPFTAGAVLLGK